MKRKNIILIVIAILFLSVTLLVKIVSLSNEGNNKVKEIISLSQKQEEKEKNFKIKGYTLENPNIIINPYGNSPLTALVLFETAENVKVSVTIMGKDELTTYTHEFDEKTKKHYIPIYGLYADSENEVIIKVDNNEKTLKIKTDKLPDDFILPTSVKKDESKLTNDLYFYTPSSKGYTCAYDTNGDVRWYLTESAIWEINRLKNGHLLLSTERLVSTPYYSTGLYEMDMLGKIYNEYSLKGGYHHDYYEMENGNLLIASNDFDNEDGTVEDYVVELDRKTGNLVKKFDLKKLLNMEDGKSENWIQYDWFHNNSVWYDKKTNSITLSGRHQDAVINIDYKTGKLNWILGDSTGWSKKYQKYFLKKDNNTEFQWSQHAAMITPEGYVFLFDNGNNKSKDKNKYVQAENSYSRGVMYKIDTKNKTVKQIFEYGKNRGSSFYSPYISDVDYLDKDHYIIHSGGISYKNGKIQNQPAGLVSADTLKSDTVELLNDQVIFEMILPTNTYRVEKMSLYSNDEFKLGKASEIGSLGKTEKNKSSFVLKMNGKKIDKKYKNYKINITKEKDRLKVTGTFKKGTLVNVILYKDNIKNIYSMRVSKTPYTALCVDLGNNNDTTLIQATKYINDVGLTGKYSIYLEINGVLYNTDEYVIFN